MTLVAFSLNMLQAFFRRSSRICYFRCIKNKLLYKRNQMNRLFSVACLALLIVSTDVASAQTKKIIL
ncbi:Uncharacterised protein [Sphingobacterium daejeonense]|nr:Uncharacterised protein [Sphingobacterium daejeonense]